MIHACPRYTQESQIYSLSTSWNHQSYNHGSSDVCCAAWWGHTKGKDRDKLEGIVWRLKRMNFLLSEDIDIMQRAPKADTGLFRAICSNPHHIFLKFSLNLRTWGLTLEKGCIILLPHWETIPTLFHVCCKASKMLARNRVMSNKNKIEAIG